MRADIERWTGGRVRPPRTGLRIGPQAAPLAVIAAVWSGGVLAHTVPGTLGWTVLTWAALTLAAGLPGLRRTTVAGSRARRRARRYLLAVTGAGVGWLTLAADVGPVGWPCVLLLVGGYTAAAPWWARRHIPIPTNTPEPEPEPAPEPEPETEAPDWMDLIPGVWAETLAAKDRVLAGSRLAERGAAPTGVTWTIRLTPGRHTTATAVAAGPLIASGLGMPLDRVTVDRHHSGDGDKAHLLVVHEGTANPLRRTHPYPGVDEAFDVESGMARLGVHADLEHALWRVYDLAIGARGGVVVGASGSGKSRLLELLGISCMYSRRVLVWIADPQEGASLPALTPHVDWAACDRDEIGLMFATAQKLISFRSKINKLLRREPHPISPTAPMVLIILDECHQVLTPSSPLTKAADEIARMGRKAGVGLICATQYPEASSYGDKISLRDSLAAANTAVLRTANKTTGGMLPGLELLDPNGLPDVAGLGYLAGKDRRTAPFRTHYEDQDVVGALGAAAPELSLEPAALAYLGETYRDRHTRRLAADADLVVELAAFDPALVAAAAAADPALAAAIDQARTRPKTPTVPAPRTPTPHRPDAGRGPAAGPGTARHPRRTRLRHHPHPRPDTGSSPAAPGVAHPVHEHRLPARPQRDHPQRRPDHPQWAVRNPDPQGTEPAHRRRPGHPRRPRHLDPHPTRNLKEIPMTRRTTDVTDVTVTAVGTVRPGSPLDRLFTHGECLLGCGRKVDAPNALCATCQFKAEADRRAETDRLIDR
ncbi:ATP-binding protein [Frankia sp. Cj3]|uniref:ATP-binding protein n=1 Tax=Frankia sp. Cj3 TaxID=2880976 RepID=UPI001EF5E6E9|nr:ATP-binding protein [Frankia sp. Cj3]